jgi:hypothetical protein
MSRLFRQATTLVFLALSTLKLSALPHADRIIIHKKERTMELMRAGQVIKTYKIALGGQPVGPKIVRCTSLIRVRRTANAHAKSVYLPGETFLSMACRMDTVSSGRHIAPAIGPMAVSL